MAPPVHARTLASEQRTISVSEFFSKNRHLLGFDSPARSLLTTVKEAVDNAIDASEEAGILPEVRVEIARRPDGIFVVAVEDGGPGIVEEQIARIFGKLLYGSKFHRLAQSRGQQGMGISAAGMYGQLTTGEPVKVISRTDPDSPARQMKISIDTRKNRPEIHSQTDVPWDRAHGTRVEIAMEGLYQHGQHSIPLYLKLTSIANPHASLALLEPDGTELSFPRTDDVVPPAPTRIKPHPHGVELGRLISMLRATESTHLGDFLRAEFSQIGKVRAKRIIAHADQGLTTRSYCRRVARKKAAALHQALAATKLPAPPLDCLVPIGEEGIRDGLSREVPAAFLSVRTRKPAVYRGNPFVVEVGLAYGRRDGAHVVVTEDGHLRKVGDETPSRAQQPVSLIRYANRVPLLYQRNHCATTRAVVETNWKRYGLDQSAGSMPIGPMTILVHVASVWMPFTSESKDAIAAYPEILREIGLALMECGRDLGKHLRHERRLSRELERRSAIERFIPHVASALQDLLDLDEAEERQLERRLDDVVQESRRVP